jgi:predicted phage-related endonuclease
MTDDLSFRQERLKNITATEMSILFGLNPYETPRSLLEKKRNPQKIDSIHLT